MSYSCFLGVLRCQKLEFNHTSLSNLDFLCNITSVPLKKIVTCVGIYSLCLCNEFYRKFLFYIAKSFKMRHITYLYFSYLSRYSWKQIQVTIFLSGTDVRWKYNHLCIAFFKLKYLGRIVLQLCIGRFFVLHRFQWWNLTSKSIFYGRSQRLCSLFL